MKTKNIDNLSLSELLTLKDLLEKGLNPFKISMDMERGHDYEEHKRKEFEYHNHSYQEKLKKVNDKIQLIIESI